MSFPKISVEDLKKQAKKYDYIRLCWPDLHGISRGKAIAGRFVDSYLENGLGMYVAMITLGPGAVNEVPNIPQFEKLGYCNMYAKPAIQEISSIPWSCEDQFKIGSIICEPTWLDGTVQEANPRYVARKQLEKLSEMGLKLYSAFELECIILNKETQEPIFSGCEVTVQALGKHEKMLYEFDAKLQKAGIDIETFQTEYSPGQFEFATKPQFGIEGLDMIFRLKEAMKEMCHNKGQHITFMTRPFASHGGANGGHLNFSLWDESGNNAFYDPNKPNNLSDIALYFIAGILKHIRAVTALCSPTINCYRRLHKLWTPVKADWGIEDRRTSFRVKNFSKSSTYMENRLASGSCNPYLAVAATVAAGIDGIINKLEPPKPGPNPDAVEVPHTLQEAIEALQSDKYMVEALGPEFVDWFTECKKQIDIAKFGNHNVKADLPDEVDKEREEFITSM